MNTPISWIKAYVPDLDCTVQEYVDKMTLSGSHVENAVYLDKNLEKIVVGRIEKIEKHPDADKLVICQVNVGDEEVQIVTGASNVFKGAMVPVVLDGGRVAGGHDGSPNPENGIKIKKGKLRGVPSYGMMCSIEELGSTRDMYPEAPEDGIYIFDESKDVKPGDDAVAALGLRDAVVEFEITSNRVDCFSMIGMAREAAATFEKPFYAPEVKEVGNNEKAEDYISVEVEATDLCPRYTARIVKNIKLAPSPEWMQRRLAAMGIRPINNIVDITNYVMEEYGQPMHAYDLNKIRGHKIVVKRANDGDVYTTLDGQERKLDKDVLMINDAEGPVGIAGIMGGENSMITDNVHTVLFEAACFNGTNIRLSSKRIGLRTDASGKFEKGLDPNNAKAAIDRACQLMEELGAGEVVGGIVDICNETREPSRVPFEPERINALLGTDLTKEEMLAYLAKVELTLDDVVGADGFSFSYEGYELDDSYPDTGEETYFAMDATEGQKLLVLKFLAHNVSGEDRELSMVSSGVRFKITAGGKTQNALTTMLLNDFSNFSETIPGNGTQELVLICEVPADGSVTEGGSDSIAVIVRNGDKNATISLQ